MIAETIVAMPVLFAWVGVVAIALSKMGVRRG